MKSSVIYFSAQGSTKRVAQIVAELTHAELKEIELPSKYNALKAYALGSIQALTKSLPELKSKLDIAGDEVIYLGSPIWYYTVAPAVQKFIAEHDLSGKKIIPFCTHRGNAGDYFARLKNLCAGADVAEGGHEFFKVTAKDDAALKAEVEAWLREIHAIE